MSPFTYGSGENPFGKPTMSDGKNEPAAVATTTPMTDAAMEACGKLPNVEMMYGYMVEHARGLERALVEAQMGRIDRALNELGYRKDRSSATGDGS